MTNHDEKTGRFVAGNKAAAGNIYTRKAAALRKALFSSITAADVQQIVSALKEQAKRGDLRAAGLLFDRLFGSITTGIDILERMEKLEAIYAEKREGGTDEND